MNEELYGNLLNATRYFQIGEELAQRLQAEEARILLLKTEYKEERNRKEKPAFILRLVGLLTLIPSGGFLGLMLLVGLFVKATKDDKVGAVVLAFAAIAGGIMLLISKALDKKIAPQLEHLKNNVIQPQIEQAEQALSVASDTIKKFVEENIHLIEFLPMQYRDLQAVSFMLLAVANGRADTLKEAINLYEEQLHRWKLENAVQQSLEMQEYLAMAVDELNSQQAETNAHLRSIEFMQYLQYLNSKAED